MSIPYPSDFDVDHEAARQAQRAALARQRLDPSDVLSEVQHLLLAIDDDAHHPLWPLVRHCTAVGTTQETGVRPYMAEQVGEALLPLIDKAIRRLVGERLDDFSAWED
jgi:hypothetical protein